MRKPVRILLIVAAVLAVITLVNVAPMISRRTPRMEQYESHGITVYAEPTDRAEVDRIAARISDRTASVVGALGATSASGISIIIYPSNKVLHRKTIGLAGVFLPDWFIGNNTTDFVLITSPANPGPVHDRESIELAAVHEYVHVLTDRRNRGLSHWLREGIALYLAGQTPTSATIRSYRDISFQEFSLNGPIRFANVGGYALAYTLIDYITTEFGWQAVVDLIEPGATYQSVLGISDRELYERWRLTLPGV